MNRSVGDKARAGRKREPRKGKRPEKGETSHARAHATAKAHLGRGRMRVQRRAKKGARGTCRDNIPEAGKKCAARAWPRRDPCANKKASATGECNGTHARLCPRFFRLLFFFASSFSLVRCLVVCLGTAWLRHATALGFTFSFHVEYHRTRAHVLDPFKKSGYSDAQNLGHRPSFVLLFSSFSASSRRGLGLLCPSLICTARPVLPRPETHSGGGGWGGGKRKRQTGGRKEAETVSVETFPPGSTAPRARGRRRARDGRRHIKRRQRPKVKEKAKKKKE